MLSNLAITDTGKVSWTNDGSGTDVIVLHSTGGNPCAGTYQMGLGKSATSYQLPKFAAGDFIQVEQVDGKSPTKLYGSVPSTSVIKKPVISAPATPVDVTSRQKFFAPNDPFNTIAGSALDANNTAWKAMYAKNISQAMEIQNVPIFYAENTDPVVTVSGTMYGGSATFNLPAAAAPIPGDDDAHMVVISPDRTISTEFWGAKRAGNTLTALTVSQFNVSVSAGSCNKPINGNTGGVRASGTSLLAGTVTIAEANAGVIPHALAFDCPYDSNTFRSPAIGGTDGTTAGGVPQGARCRLDPSFDISTLTDAPNTVPGHMKALATAAQKYGMFVVDTTNGGSGFYAEASSDGASAPAGWAVQGYGGRLSGFPWADLQWLAA